MAKGKYQEWLTPEGLLKIEGWARDGLTDEQIAKNMGIAYSTLKNWKDDHLAILAALKKGKEVVDREVENALYERALGGVHEVKKTFKVKRTFYDEEGRKCEKEELKTGIDEVYIPGDTTAQIFWLKNRKPEQWRDKQEVQDTAAVEKLDDILEEMRSNAIKQQTE
jgi:hypothetical protein